MPLTIGRNATCVKSFATSVEVSIVRKLCSTYGSWPSTTHASIGHVERGIDWILWRSSGQARNKLTVFDELPVTCSSCGRGCSSHVVVANISEVVTTQTHGVGIISARNLLENP